MWSYQPNKIINSLTSYIYALHPIALKINFNIKTKLLEKFKI